MAKSIELYNKTVDILFQAYFNDTLVHGDCARCAVGNICRAAGFPETKSPIDNDSLNSGAWKGLFSTGEGLQEMFWCEDGRDGWNKSNALYVIRSTGYTVHELASIEYVFETSAKGNSNEDYMFNSLVAVLEVLKQIHEIDDNTDQVKRFTAHHKVRVSA